MVFRPELSWEFLSEDEIASKSLRALRNHIRHAKEVSAHYQAALGQVDPDEIRTLDDFARLPFTERTHLAGSFPRFLGAPSDKIAETVFTAGTDACPMPFVYTTSDLERAAFSTALSMHGIEITAADRVALLIGLDGFFLDGIALYGGIHALGANCIRLGSADSGHANVQRHLEFFKPTVLIGSPSVVHAIALEANRKGYDSGKSNVEKILCTNESIHTHDLRLNAKGRMIEHCWNAKAFSLYLSTELAVAYAECPARKGRHSHPELVYTEIVDEAGKPLPDGEVGELVATPLGVEGIPLVRYRTGDMTFRLPGSCECGRNSCRIGPVFGRRSQLFTYKNMVVYPLALTNALDAIDDIKDYLVTIEKDDNQADSAAVHVAAPPSALEKITLAIREATGVHIPVLVSNIPTITALRGGNKKRKPIQDNRPDKMNPKST